MGGRGAGYVADMAENTTSGPRPEDEQADGPDGSAPRDSEEPQGDLSDDEQVGRAESEGGMTGEPADG
ncbi:MAG TPA: hypothetical protein VFJ89_09500 [Nocardioides sp.]|nr:hypothetical protein [Nocardioides sp.]